jgi:hypothetical protein
MHHDTEIVTFEVNPVIADAKPMQHAPGTFKFPEIVQLGMQHLLGQAAEFAQDLKLKFLRHLGQFYGAGRIENDLKWAHQCRKSRTPESAGQRHDWLLGFEDQHWEFS